MTVALPSTVAQLLFAAPLAMPFDQIVDEVAALLDRYPAETRRMTRDGGFAAVFDLDASRVLICLCDPLRGDPSACLTVSVGSNPGATMAGPLSDRRTALCRRIADRLGARFTIEDVIWHEIGASATPDLHGRTTSTLPGVQGEGLRPRRVSRRHPARSAALARAMRPEAQNSTTAAAQRAAPPDALISAAHPAMAASAAALAQDSATRACARANSARIRAALYPARAVAAQDRPSIRLRIAMHALNAIAILALLPLGAALMNR